MTLMYATLDKFVEAWSNAADTRRTGKLKGGGVRFEGPLAFGSQDDPLAKLVFHKGKWAGIFQVSDHGWIVHAQLKDAYSRNRVNREAIYYSPSIKGMPEWHLELFATAICNVVKKIHRAKQHRNYWLQRMKWLHHEANRYGNRFMSVEDCPPVWTFSDGKRGGFGAMQFQWPEPALEIIRAEEVQKRLGVAS